MKFNNIQSKFRRMLRFIVAIIFLLFSSFVLQTLQKKPTLYLIGDSTVKNGKGKGDGGLWGWGNFIEKSFDTTKISIRNEALGGTSSRTFQTMGLWNKVLNNIKPGDYVLMQFGHNDSSPLDDTARARGTISGNNDESRIIDNPKTNMKETVYSYGWYIRKFISDTKAKGATPVVLSPVPRNSWSNGKVNRAINDYGGWAASAAKQGGALFIDLNQIIAVHYDEEGEERVKAAYFNNVDHTHTIEAGAILNAASVVEGIKKVKECGLNKYILSKTGIGI
jgi:lysophospholipase L1-like esterase